MLILYRNYGETLINYGYSKIRGEYANSEKSDSILSELYFKIFDKGGFIMRPKWSIWGLKLLWFAGLLGLILIGYHFKLKIEQIFDETFNPLYLIWYNSILPFLFGIYISLLFVKKWSFKINTPLLLCVAVPCLILSFYGPFVISIPFSFNLPEPFWLLQINTFDIAPVVAGLTIVVGLFEGNRPSKNENSS